MPIRIVVDQNQVSTRIMNVWKNDVLAPLSEEILADCNEYCKEDQRTLINSSLAHSKPEQGKLIWETPYARRQYWEIQTSLMPGRTWKWCETAKRRWKRRWAELAEKLLRSKL